MHLVSVPWLCHNYSHNPSAQFYKLGSSVFLLARAEWTSENERWCEKMVNSFNFSAGAAALFNQFLSARVQQHTHKCLQLSLCKRYTFLGILQEETANSGERGVATTKHRRSGCENCTGRTSSRLLNLCSGTCRGPNIRVLATQWTTARVSKRIFIEA